MIAVEPTYCPTCGTELVTREFEGRARDHCSACDRTWWRQSVPTTSVAVCDDERVLLIERADGPDAGRWDLPAGHPESDEPAREAAARELREETGLRVDPQTLELVGTSLRPADDATYRSIDYRVARASTTGTVTPGSDAANAQFHAPAAIRGGAVDVRELGRRRLAGVGIVE